MPTKRFIARCDGFVFSCYDFVDREDVPGRRFMYIFGTTGFIGRALQSALVARRVPFLVSAAKYAYAATEQRSRNLTIMQ